MQVEQQWANEEEHDDEGGMHDSESISAASMPDDQLDSTPVSAAADEVDIGYVQMFMMRFLCPQEDCGGTLAPILGTDVQECNRCSHKRTNAEFMALAASMEEGDELSD